MRRLQYKQLFVALTLLASATTSFHVDAQQTVVDETFDQFFLFKGDIARALGGHRHTSIIYNQGVSNSKALKVYYQGNERGSERIVIPFSLSEKGTAAQLSFDVKFCEGFDFARGGKLHGFGPENPITGGKPMTIVGWSARAMWGPDGSVKSYIYHQDMKGRYGDGQKATGFRFQPGQYHNVQYRMKLNQPASASNGYFNIFIDGRQVVSHQGLRFRASQTQDTLINQFLFSTFHGGSSPDWAPRDEYGRYKQDCAIFDNFRLQITE